MTVGFIAVDDAIADAEGAAERRRTPVYVRRVPQAGAPDCFAVATSGAGPVVCVVWPDGQVDSRDGSTWGKPGHDRSGQR
jgi:hypothetical protein